MESWYELKQKKDTTNEEKIIIVCVEAIHESKTIDTESEEKTYNVLCARVGASIDGEDETPPDEDTGDGEDEGLIAGKDEIGPDSDPTEDIGE